MFSPLCLDGFWYGVIVAYGLVATFVGGMIFQAHDWRDSPPRRPR